MPEVMALNFSGFSEMMISALSHSLSFRNFAYRIPTISLMERLFSCMAYWQTSFVGW